MENQEEACLIEEIILDILHRLPHETLQRFCSVSKSWLDMIANPGRPDSCYSVRLKTYQKLPSNTSTLLGFFYPKTEHNSLYINWVPISVPPELSQSVLNKLHHDNDGGDYDDDDMELKAIAKQLHDPLPILDESSLSLFNKPDGDDEYMELKASSSGYLLCQIIQGCDSGEGDNWIPYPHYYSVVNPLNQQQRVDLPVVYKPVGGGAAIAFECNDSSPVEFTVVLIEHSPQPNYPALEIKVFSSNLNMWREFQLCVEDHFLSFSGSIPGVNLQGRFFWLCDNQNFLLMFDQTRPTPTLTTWKLPTHQSNDLMEPYNYRALCTLNNLIWYGVQYQTKKIIQVFMKRPPFLIRNRVWCDHVWELIYEVQLQELEHECRQIMMKVTWSGLDGDDDGEGDLVNSMIFKGFHPTNPKIIFVIFQGMLISYECEAKKLVVCTAQDTNLPISTSATEELNIHLIPFERWAWPNSLPRI